MGKIRLSEEKLRNIIKESVKRVINEVNRNGFEDPYKEENESSFDEDCFYFFDSVCELKKAAKYAKMAGAYDENGKLDTDKGALIFFRRIANLNSKYDWGIDYQIRKNEVIGTIPIENGETVTIEYDAGGGYYIAKKDIPESYGYNTDGYSDYDSGDDGSIGFSEYK